MTGLSADRSEEPLAIQGVGRRGLLLTAAWSATLLLSKLPLVIARDLLNTDVPWITPAWVAAAALLIGASTLWPRLRPLRRCFVVMGLIVLLGFVVDPAIRGTALWASLTAGRPEMQLILLDRVLLMLQAVVVLGAVLLMGTPRREAFLAVGDLAAPFGGRAAHAAGQRRALAAPPDVPGSRRLSWAVLAPLTALVLGGLFYLALASLNPALRSDPAAVVPWLPLIVLSAALNALGEEGTFRAAPLSTLLPAVGPSHALWMTCVWFGLGHYYGGFPSGPAGAIQSGLLAVLMGKAMLDTRGLGWPWGIHFVIDGVIYMTLAATAA